jgi:hypothetical protein
MSPLEEQLRILRGVLGKQRWMNIQSTVLGGIEDSGRHE